MQMPAGRSQRAKPGLPLSRLHVKSEQLRHSPLRSFSKMDLTLHRTDVKRRSELEIRFLTTDDANKYWKLRLEALEGDPEAFSSSAEEHRSLSLDEVKRRLGADGAGDFFVVGAFENDRLVGTAGFYRERGPKIRHKGRIWGVYVTPVHRGAGVGKKMMQLALERGATVDGIEQVILSVAATQTAANKLYRSLGFEPFGREPRALKIGDRFIDEEYFVLPGEKLRLLANPNI
jgi:RimJ/RimL family protein N-acetyltransferase